MICQRSRDKRMEDKKESGVVDEERVGLHCNTIRWPRLNETGVGVGGLRESWES